MRIELNCAQCGNNHFALDRDHGDDAYVRCQDCGHEIGTMAELKEKMAAEVLKRSRLVATAASSECSSDAAGRAPSPPRR